ncbi:MAG: hypothetical protein PWQ91_792 [Eubacteriales bacterium]|nr:hypothetical protein [Eubacteriales bacterium]MDN5363731.1 hypothetical protein [Eubacteriales bacterium]
MKIPGNLLTTAMGILPHTDIDRAINLALSLDIPFWPQLPKVSFYEDMYVQVTENFPGISVDEKEQKIYFNTEKFYEELAIYAENIENKSYFALTGKYSVVYHRFLERPELKNYQLIRGQSIGPVSFGLKIFDENRRPLIYNDEVKSVIFDIIARKINVQYRELAAINPNAFVWVDEPGLSFIFGSFTGYPSSRAAADYREFLANLEDPKGVHLCGNPDWSFLLREIEINILSLDIYSNGHIFVKYVDDIKNFLDRGGIIAWGITPTLTEELTGENVRSLAEKLEDYWSFLAKAGIDLEKMLRQSWLAPSRCCLVNADGEKSVELSFAYLRELSAFLREKYRLY